MITIGSLFSGIGGLDLGLEMAIPDAKVVWQCELAPFPRAILEDRWPGVQLYRDVREIDARATRPDLICGGFPCTDVSVAGEGAGVEGETDSGLWWEFRRIVRALRPRVVFIENVYRGWRRWLPLVRRSLYRVGYPSLPIRVSASDVGAPHDRARVFVLAYSDRGRREGLGLPEQGGLVGEPGDVALRRHPPGWKFPPGPDAVDVRDDPKPAVRRGVDGLSRWVDRSRLEALGNAVVPLAAARAWSTLAPLLPPGLLEPRGIKSA